MDIQQILADIKSGTPKKIILDTDAYNEIDDQFAIAYAILSSDRISEISFNAAPFLNSRSVSAEDGMIKSYNEIFNIIKLVKSIARPEIAEREYKVYHGSGEFLKSKDTPVESEAADNIINTVMTSQTPVYIVAIGAITNVASAIIKCPEIVKRAALVWLGGNSMQSANTHEFNLYQDVLSAQVVFDSKIPLIQIPCDGVCTEFVTTIPELEYYLAGKNELCDYLVNIVRSYTKKPYGWSKIIWDVTALAVLIKPDALSMVRIPAPYVDTECRYSYDLSRHHYIYVRKIKRDPIYADLFKKLSCEI